jgi:hypothetical protein
MVILLIIVIILVLTGSVSGFFRLIGDLLKVLGFLALIWAALVAVAIAVLFLTFPFVHAFLR